jgi:hypothetical protein
MNYPIIKYTDPASVIEIMKAFGSKGFNNSEYGLFYYVGNKCEFVAKKGQSVTKDNLTKKIVCL